MASSYTGLGTELMTTGENAGTWGTTTNTNLQIIEQISGGYTAQSIAGSAQTTTLSVSDGSTGAVLAHRVIEFTGTITGNQIVTIPLDVQTFYIVKNNTSGAYTVHFKYVSGSGSSVTWAATDKGTKLLYAAADHASNPNLVDSNIGGVGAVDLDGNELTLDADSDTSITASTDDQIDFEIAGADDFTMTANAFNVLTGSHATFADSANAKFGTGNDMLMYHDGSNSYITNATGALKLATETSGIAVTIGHSTSEVTIADNLTVTGTLTLGSNAELTEAELEFLDGITAGTAAASKAMVADGNIDITGGRNITISGELDAATGDFSGDVDVDGTLEADAITIGSTAIGSIYGVVAGSSSIVTTGALDSGSITSGFGTIDTGSSTITTTGLISGGSLDIDNVLINGTTIGHTDDTDLLTVADGALTVAGTIGSGAITSTGIVTGTAFTAGSAVLAEAELELLDGLTAGTAIASKVVTTDSSIDTTGQRNLTISGELDAATGDFSGDVDVDGTLEADAITINSTAIGSIYGVVAGSSSILTTGALDSGSITSGFGAIDNGTSNIRSATITAETAFVPDASGGADLGTTALEFNDLFLNDSGSIQFGDDQDTTLTHTGGTGLTLNGTNKLCFYDAALSISSSTDEQLDLIADTEIQIAATTIDINGAVALNGAITGATDITLSGELDAATLDISGNADIDGTTNLDAVDIDGAVQIDAAFTSGVDGQGYDTKFFGDTSSAYMLWDTSADDLVFAGAAGIDLAGDIDVDGTANLDVVDIDGAVDMASTLAVAGVSSFAVAANVAQVALTSSSNAVAWDASAAANAYHITTENTTLSAPTNAVEGAFICIEINFNGSHTFSWNAIFNFAADTAPTTTDTDGKTDIFVFRYNGAIWQEVGRTLNIPES